jgi:hypothetical protein
MRRLLYLLIGLLVAIVLGILYARFSAPLVPMDAVTPPPGTGREGNRLLMLAAVVVAWVSALLPLPRWLSIPLGLAIVWVGFEVMAVTGFIVYLQAPNYTFADGAFAGFWCGIAMVASRVWALLKYLYRESEAGGI